MTESSPSRTWVGESVPESVSSIPNMLTEEEAQYLIWVASKHSAGSGAVVDLGPWLGCSSAALAEGLVRAGVEDPVQSFDLFEWRPSYMSTYLDRRLEDGDDFIPLFREFTASYGDRIRPQKADLMEHDWQGGPIDILFVDAAKSWGLTNAILRDFGPSLVPGQSTVILQDFKHTSTYWLPLLFGGQPDVWQELHDVVDGDTVAYRLLKPLTEKVISRASFDVEVVMRVFEPFFERRRDQRFGLSYIRALLAYGPESEADAVLERLLDKKSDTEVRSIRRSEQRIRKQARAESIQEIWQAFAASDLETARRGVGALDGVADDPDVLFVRGRLAQVEGRLGDADTEYRKALELPGAARLGLLLSIAECQIAAGEFDQAEQSVVELLLYEPKVPVDRRGWAMHVLRRAWLNRGDADRARAARDRILEKFADAPEVLVAAAVIEHATDNREGARDWVSRALAVDENHREARDLLAVL